MGTWQQTEINRRGTLFHFFPVWHYFLPSTNSKLVCSYSSSFRYKVRLTIERFLEVGLNFSFRTDFAASHRLWKLVI